MAVDLAIDYNTGDLIFAPNLDAELRRGQSVVDQRIRVRLRVIAGAWDLDTTGTLGSNLNEVLRMPMERALLQVPLTVKEALEPMTDIDVMDVAASANEDNPRAIDINITYRINDQQSDLATDLLSTNVTLVG